MYDDEKMCKIKFKQINLLMNKSNNPKVKETEFDIRIIDFIVNTMSPLSIIENYSFINLFQNFDVKVMC